MRRYLHIYAFSFLASLTYSAEVSPKIYEAVEILALSPENESPIEINRDMLPQQFDKKIILGLVSSYRFSRLLAIWREQSSDAKKGRIAAPHVLITAVSRPDARFEIAVDLDSGAVELNGAILKDSSTRRDILSYVRETVGKL